MARASPGGVESAAMPTTGRSRSRTDADRVAAAMADPGFWPAPSACRGGARDPRLAGVPEEPRRCAPRGAAASPPRPRSLPERRPGRGPSLPSASATIARTPR